MPVSVHDSENPMVLKQQVAKQFNVTDKRGRVITLQEPPFMAQFRLLKAMGPVDAKNQPLYQAYLPLITIVSIDGIPVVLPSTPIEIEHLMQTLDQDGYIAVIEGYTENILEIGISAEAAQEELKNS